MLASISMPFVTAQMAQPSRLQFSANNDLPRFKRNLPPWYMYTPMAFIKKRAARKKRFSGEGLQRLLRHHIRTSASAFMTKLRYLPLPTSRDNRLDTLSPRYRELFKDSSILKDTASDETVTFMLDSTSLKGRMSLDRKRASGRVFPIEYAASFTPSEPGVGETMIVWERKDKGLEAAQVHSALIPSKGQISKKDYKTLKKTITDTLRYIAGWFDEKAVI